MTKTVKYLAIFFIISNFGCCFKIASFDETKPQEGEFYFPIESYGIRGTNDKLDTFENWWYSNKLYSIDEPIIYNLKNKNIEIYRFTVLYSDPYMTTYRVVKTDSIIFTKKEIDIYNDTMSIMTSDRKTINQFKWEELLNKIDKTAFWKMSTHQEGRGLDGSNWILEGYRQGEYHFISRWSADHNDRLKELVDIFNYLQSI